MNQVTSFGKFIFLTPFFFSGVAHLMGTTDIGAVPDFIPGGIFWIYLTGIGMLAFVVSMMLGKYDKLAAVLLAVMLLIFAFAVQLPQQGSNTMWIAAFLKDIGLAGGALMIADKYARDAAVIG
jgi:putative oxidoreductase